MELILKQRCWYVMIYRELKYMMKSIVLQKTDTIQLDWLRMCYL